MTFLGKNPDVIALIVIVLLVSLTSGVAGLVPREDRILLSLPDAQQLRGIQECWKQRVLERLSEGVRNLIPPAQL